MNTNVFLFDLTRHRGLVQSLIGSAQAHAESFQAVAVEWFLSPTQHVDETSLSGTSHTIHRVADYQVFTRIESRIQELSSNGFADSVFHVYSYMGYILGKAAALRKPTLVVTTSNFDQLSGSGNHRNDQAGPGMSVSEAIDLTKKVLAEEGHLSESTALRQFHLRPRLIARDRRAIKRWSDPTSVNLVSEVVRDGLQNGWLKRIRLNEKTGTERIWLIQSSTSIPDSALNQAISPAKAPPDLAIAAFSGMGVQSPEASTILNKGKQRTQEMTEVLKRAFVYSPSNIRRYVFSAMQEMKADVQGKTVAQFLRGVEDCAKAKADKDAVSFTYWSTAMGAILEMLLLSEALAGPDSKPIKRGLQARGTTMTAIADDFEDKCALFLLKFLIQHMQLTSKDRTSIAHALFKEGRAEKTQDQLGEQLDRLFVLLGDDLSESTDGILILESESKQKAPVQTVH